MFSDLAWSHLIKINIVLRISEEKSTNTTQHIRSADNHTNDEVNLNLDIYHRRPFAPSSVSSSRGEYPLSIVEERNIILGITNSYSDSISLLLIQQKLRGPHKHTKDIASYEMKTPNPVFEAAISIEDFKNIDPEQFEWVNPDEIRPGETTCGFLNAPLGWEVEELDIVYPMVKMCTYLFENA